MSGRVNGERQGVVRSTSAALPGKNVPGLANPAATASARSRFVADKRFDEHSAEATQPSETKRFVSY